MDEDAGSRERPVGDVIDELLDHAGEVHDRPALMCDVRAMEPVLATEHDGSRYVLMRGHPAEDRHTVALSSRELEIARMIAVGHTNRTIAAVLEISQWTVSTHLRRIFAKLDVRSRPAMVAKLVADGLLDD
jgi:DNA-binding CsgD family transcriptional regulator